MELETKTRKSNMLIKRALCIFMTVLMLLSSFGGTLSAFATDDVTAVESGFCGAHGENLAWILYDNGELVISGEGEMAEYNWENRSPFIGSDAITSVVVEDGVTSISACVFASCKNLVSVRISDSVTSIGNCVFMGCDSLADVELGAGLAILGDGAFEGCTSLESITFPSTLTALGTEEGMVFTGCTKLEDIYFQGTEDEWNAIKFVGSIETGATVHFNSDGNIDEDNVADEGDGTDGNVAEYTISAGETKEINIASEKITYIEFTPEESGNYEFYSSTEEYTDTYGYLYDSDKNEITHDDDSAGAGNFRITYYLEAGVTYYWGARFYEESRSGSFNVTLEKACDHLNAEEKEGKEPTCTEEGYSAGKYCPDCETWLWGHDYIEPTHIDDDSDRICDRCSEEAILSNGECGDGEAFYKIYTDGTLEITGKGNIQDYYFEYSGTIKKIIINEGIEAVGSYSFYDCVNLTSVELASSVSRIGDYGFARCDNLEKIVINNPDCKIADSKETIPSNAVIYGHRDSTAKAYAEKYDRAFKLVCDHTETKEVAETEPDCTETGYTAGVQCENCEEWLEGHEEIPAYNHIDEDEDLVCDRAECGHAFEVIKEGYCGYDYRYEGEGSSGEGSYVTDNATYTLYDTGLLVIEGTGRIGLDESTESGHPDFVQIEEDEWGDISVNDKFIKKIIIKEGIKEIGFDFFANLRALTEVSLPDSLTAIDGDAFYNCENLKDVFIPAGVTHIGVNAFNGCTSIEKFTVAEDNQLYYSDEHGVVYREEFDEYSGVSCGRELILFPKGSKLTSYTVGEDVKYVYFSGDVPEKLAEITILNPEAYIGFDYLNNLKKIRGYRLSSAEVFARNNDVKFEAVETAEAESLVIEALPKKTRFRVDSGFDYGGLKLKLNYTDGTSRIITTGFYVSDVDMSTPGDKEVTISLCDYNLKYTINVYKYVAPELAVDNTTEIQLDSSSSHGMYFTPAKSGTYRFKLEADTYMYLYYVAASEMDGGEWSWDDSTQFEDKGTWTLNLEGGVKYYFEAHPVEGERSFSITPECLAADCDHGETTKNDGLEPTCTEDGYTASEKCNICSAWVKERKTIPAAHIDEDDNLVCDKGDCGYVFGVVKEGYCGCEYKHDDFGSTSEGYYTNENATFTLYDTGLLVIEGTGKIGFDETSDTPYPDFAQVEGYGYVNDNFIKKIIIREGITEIGYYTFMNLHALTEIELPDSLETIKGYAFANCENLGNVYIPENVSTLSSASFDYCTSIEKFTVAESNEIYSSDEYGVVYFKTKDENGEPDGRELKLFPANRKITAYTFADDVKYVFLPESLPLTLREITFLNPETFIDVNGTVHINKVYGYRFSSAESFAENYGISFTALDSAEIESVEIDTLPKRTSFRTGQFFDYSGLKLKVNYTDGTSRIITSGFDVSDVDTATAGDKEVTVTIGDYTLTYTVNVFEYVVPVLKTGETTEITLDTGLGYGMYFTPAKTGEYKFKLETDCGMELCYTDNPEAADEWDWIYSKWFYESSSWTIELEGGVKYYFRAYSENDGNNFSITPECVYAECDHEDTTKYDGLEPTCTVDGYTASEKCNICTMWVEKAKTIPAAHIDENGDLVCDRADCGHKYSVIKEGYCGYKYISDEFGEGCFNNENASFTLYDTGLLVIEGTGEIGLDPSMDYPYPLFAQTKYEEGSDGFGGYTYVDDHFIKKIIIKDGITTIRSNLFSELHALTEIELPYTLENISSNAFSYCENLKSVHIPANTTYISEDAFYGCSSIEKFTVAEGNEYYYSDEYGVVYFSYTYDDGEYSHYIHLFPRGGKMKSYTVAADVSLFSSYCYLPESLKELTVLNPDMYMDIYDHSSLDTIRGYRVSTAQSCAENWGINFVPIDEVEIESVEIDTLPEKRTFRQGQSFNYNGLKLKINYEDGTSRVASEGFRIDDVENVTDTLGEREVVVVAGEHTVTYTIDVYEYIAPTLTVGETTEIPVEIYMSNNMYFTPAKDGEYKFTVKTKYGADLRYVEASAMESEDWFGDWTDYNRISGKETWTLYLEGGVKYCFDLYNEYDDNTFSITPECISAECDHEDTTAYEADEVSCDKPGYTAGVKCNECTLWLEGHELVTVPHTDEDKDNICDVCENSLSDISLDEEKEIEIIGGEVTYLKFVPLESGEYTFYSKAGEDTRGYICDENKDVIDENDDFNGSDFAVTAYLDAGVTYYFGARYYAEENSGEFKVVVSYGNRDDIFGNDDDDDDDDDDYYGELCENGFIAQATGDNECVIFNMAEARNIAAENGGVLVVPATIEGKTVIGFENNGLIDYESVIKSITFPATVQTIPVNAFVDWGFENLEEIIVDDENQTYKSVDGVLYNYDLTEILAIPAAYNGTLTIPDSVTSVDSQVFALVKNIENIVFGENADFYFDGYVLYNKAKTRVIKAFGLKGDYVMPETVEAIDKYAFTDQDELEKVTVSSNVTEIVYGAFADSDALSEIELPEGLEAIGLGAFESCDSLKSIDLNEGLKTIEYKAFYESGLESVSLPSTITDGMGGMVFSNCKNLKAVDLGTGLTDVSYSSFSGCTALETITFPVNVKRIYHDAFSATGIKELYIPDNIEYIDGSFTDCDSLKSVVVGDGTTSISGAFRGCDNLETVYLGKNVVSVEQSFYGCHSLRKVEAADGFNGDMYYAFYNCKNLSEVILPDTVQEITYSAFRDCTSLDEFELPAELNSVGAHSLDNTKWLNDKPEGETYMQNVLYNYKGELPENYTLEVKNGTTIIADSAFESEDNLKHATLPDGLKYIGDASFFYSGLTDIVIPSSVVRIDFRAFAGCESLADVYYGGTEEQWKQIEIGEWNEPLLEANIHFTKPTHVHSYTAKVTSPTCTAEGYTTYTCSCGDSYVGDKVGSLGHKAGSAASCTEPQKCTVCKTVLKNATGHKAGSAATCTEAQKCTVCKTVLKEATGHKAGAAATCTEAQKCTVCKTVLKNATGHKAGAAATCTKAQKCTVCKATIKEALGHSWEKSYTTDKKATYKADGSKSKHCSRKGCDAKKSVKTIEMLTLSKVKGLKVTQTEKTLTVSWTKVKGAQEYEVCYSTNGKKWTKVTTSKNKVTIKKLKAGTTYKVKVRAEAGSNTGVYSSVLTTSTKPSKVTLSSVKSSKAKQITVNWKTVSGATGYVVEYSTSKSFKKKSTVSVKKPSSKKTTLKKLKSGKKYYVRVKAYKTVDGKKLYGATSSVKSVKVK